MLRQIRSDFLEFGKTLGWYSGRKARYFASFFESGKAVFVDVLKARRGTYQKPFLHVGMVLLLITGVLTGPLIINQYPTAANAESVTSALSPSAILNNQADITNIDTVTKESEKPRRDIIEYTVQGGDTLSSIAKKFSQKNDPMDVDSIAYLNNFSDSKILKPGDVIKIPPTAGVIVDVKSGDTIYSLAKKYGLPSAQPIVDWPYNSFVDDEKFSLASGQTLVIPGGRAPAVVQIMPSAPRSTPGSGIFTPGNGQFSWPVQGLITQYFAWYHTGIDIAGPIGTAVTAADSGRVVSALYDNYGYGYHVIIDHGNGYQTLYGHLSRIDVGAGQNVSRGQQLGLRGSTGRSTGPHVHFEVRRGGAFQNPMEFLR